MGKFNKNGSREMPELNTSSLPDLIFAFLFFIMMVTSIREVTPLVEYSGKLPHATELTKLEEKSLVSYLYVGKPVAAYRAKFGNNSCIQINDKIVQNTDLIYDFAKQEEAKIPDERKKLMTISIKADADTKMKIISDIKYQLRRADVLNISYSARQQVDN